MVAADVALACWHGVYPQPCGERRPYRPGDSSEHFLGLRLNFYIACGLMLFGFAWFARIQRTGRRPAKGAALLAIGAILCAATAGCSHAAHPGQPAAMATERQPGSPGGGPVPLP